MFERMEVEEQFYKGGSPSEITAIRVDANRASRGRKIKGFGANSPTKSKKICAGKCRKHYAGHPSNQTNSD